MLMGLLASNGLSVEALLCMSQEKQRVHPLYIHTYMNYTALFTTIQEALSTAIASKIAHNNPPPVKSAMEDTNQHNTLDLATALKGSTLYIHTYIHTYLHTYIHTYSTYIHTVHTCIHSNTYVNTH